MRQSYSTPRARRSPKPRARCEDRQRRTAALQPGVARTQETTQEPHARGSWLFSQPIYLQGLMRLHPPRSTVSTHVRRPAVRTRLESVRPPNRAPSARQSHTPPHPSDRVAQQPATRCGFGFGRPPACQLLARFARHRDEAAFTALVERHGPMVLHLCRRVLGDVHAAEDAFQATFLVLARKAHALARPAALAGWLYGVAYRVALKARTVHRRRSRALATNAPAPRDPPPAPLSELSARELLSVLEQELFKLPDSYRMAIVCCCLETLTVEEVAARLGCT